MALRKIILYVCDRADPVLHKLRRLVLIKAEGQPSVFRVRLMRYRGAAVRLSDGCSISKGDVLLKIHLHNIHILQLLHSTKSQIKKTYQIYRLVDQALPALGEYVQQHPLRDDIKAICGITMIDQLVERLGFEVKPIKSRAFRLLKYTTQTPIQLLATGSFTDLFKKKNVSYLMMSKNELLQYRPKTKRGDGNSKAAEERQAANLY
ncbi:hypothetical protein SAMN05421736_108107 [Evansella caseinilytica]|uniref:YkoP-like domain-containing protein n=1 Tax=Evansella caseinilytica TaxID=1503961 RepID=A0A1H3RHJ3_9BACI|nr:hypothetical protein [Evansella caseinilytica]SDZ25126.1 hypothetical protein SAMN05421736_108107 [Evansella caseinilytica]